MVAMSREQFDRMEASFNEAASGMHENVGISVAAWRLQHLMSMARWALDHGYELPNGR